jgi:outer membrane protein TolC
MVAQRAAQADQARFGRAATELAVRTEVVDAYRAFVAAAEEATVYERDVLQPARTNQALLETAYRAGKVGLPTLVLLRNQLLDAELGYWDAWLAARLALIDLSSATATLPIDSNLDTPDDR